MEQQLSQEQSLRERIEQENLEIKEIWESEVKAKHKLTEKVREREGREGEDTVMNYAYLVTIHGAKREGVRHSSGCGKCMHVCTCVRVCVCLSLCVIV